MGLSSRLLLVALSTGCAASRVPPTLEPGDIVVYHTADGWELDLRHYPGHGPPVMLVHGMGANHYNWDYRPEVSFAYYLHQQGWDVWVPQLRGDRGARAPNNQAAKNFTFDDFARLDLPAATDAVLASTHAEKLYWVGHSMGGMLLYTSLSLFPEKLAAGVAIGAPAEFEVMEPIHNTARRAGWLVPERGMLANLFWYRVTRVFGDKNPLYGVLSNRENLDWPVIRGLGAVALENLSRATVKQVHLWLRTRQFTDIDGNNWVRPSAIEVPMLVMGGSVDHVAPAGDVAAACETWSPCEFVLMGRESGFSTDYGHIDPVVGTTARDEIYPIIHNFLVGHLPDGVVLGGPPDDFSPVVDAPTEPEPRARLPRVPAPTSAADVAE